MYSLSTSIHPFLHPSSIIYPSVYPLPIPIHPSIIHSLSTSYPSTICTIHPPTNLTPMHPSPIHYLYPSIYVFTYYPSILHPSTHYSYTHLLVILTSSIQPSIHPTFVQGLCQVTSSTWPQIIKHPQTIPAPPWQSQCVHLKGSS